MGGGLHLLLWRRDRTAPDDGLRSDSYHGRLVGMVTEEGEGHEKNKFNVQTTIKLCNSSKSCQRLETE